MDRELIRKGIFKNCLEVQHTEKGIIPLRFTVNQHGVFSKSEKLSVRAYCTAGVCLDLWTDSTFLRFDYELNGKTRDWIYFDVYLNELFIESMGSLPIDTETRSFFYGIPDAGEKLNRITVYLPHNIALIIKNIELSDGAQIKGVELQEKNLLCLGDSITQGMDAYHPSSTYPVLLSRHLGMNLLNQGVGGYIFNADSLDHDIPYKPDIVTVAYGTNDWVQCESILEFRNNCGRYIEKLTECFSNSKIYVITPLWRANLNEVKRTGRFSDISNAIADICGRYPNLRVINGMELLPHRAEYMLDGKVHPKDEGFLHITLNLAKKIK